MKVDLNGPASLRFTETKGELTARKGPDMQVPFEVSEYENQLCVSIPGQDCQIVAEILLEVYNGQLIAYIWSEYDIGDDPIARIVLLEDAEDRTWKEVPLAQQEYEASVRQRRHNGTASRD